MLAQEERWKAMGCGMMMLLVLLCFWGMLSATNGLVKTVKAKRARVGQTALGNLEAAGIAIAAYEADLKKVPPTESPAALKAALVPTYLADGSVLSEPTSGKPFVPNRNVQPGKQMTSYARRNVYMLAAPALNKSGKFEVLLLSGETREVSPAELTRLANPPALPVRVPTPEPAGSPAPVRK